MVCYNDSILLQEIYEIYGVSVDTKIPKSQIVDKIVQYKNGELKIEELYRYIIPTIIQYAYSNIKDVSISESISEMIEQLPHALQNFNLSQHRDPISTILCTIGNKIRYFMVKDTDLRLDDNDKDPYGDDPIDVIESKILSLEIDNYISNLNLGKQIIIKMYYGLGCEKRDTLYIYRETQLPLEKINKIIHRFEEHLNKLQLQGQLELQ